MHAILNKILAQPTGQLLIWIAMEPDSYYNAMAADMETGGLIKHMVTNGDALNHLGEAEKCNAREKGSK